MADITFTIDGTTVQATASVSVPTGTTDIYMAMIAALHGGEGVSPEEMIRRRVAAIVENELRLAREHAQNAAAIAAAEAIGPLETGDVELVEAA